MGTGLFDDLPDVATTPSAAAPKAAKGMFDDLPDLAPAESPQAPTYIEVPPQLPRLGAAVQNPPRPVDKRAELIYEAPARIAKSAATGTGDAVRGAARYADMVSPEQPNEAQFFAQKLAEVNTEAFPNGVDTKTSLLTLADVPPPIVDQWRTEYRQKFGSQEDRLSKSTLANVGQQISADARKTYTTDPLRDDEFKTAVFEGLGSTVPVVAASAIPGVGLPLAAGQYGLSQAEQAAQEAQDMGGSETQADIAFLGNAGVGAFTEGIIGMGPRVWEMISKIRKAGVKPESFGKAVAKAIGEGVLREGSQEGLEQFTQNLIASDVAGYDPNRPAMEGVAKNAAVGAVVGGLTGGSAVGAERATRPGAEPLPRRERKPVSQEPAPVFDPKEIERILRDNQLRPEPEAEPQAPPAPPVTPAPAETVQPATPKPSEMAETLDRLLRENAPATPATPEPAKPLPNPEPTGDMRNQAGGGPSTVARPSLQTDLEDLQGTMDAIRKKLEAEQQSRKTPEVLPSPAAETEAGAVVPVPPAAAPASLSQTPSRQDLSSQTLTKGQRVESSRYGKGEVVRQIGKRYQVQFDDGTKFTVSPGELTRLEEAKQSPGVVQNQELAAAFEKYDGTGEIQTVRDLANEVESLIAEGKAPASLQAQIDAYRSAIEEDARQFGDRAGLEESAGDKFVSAVRAIAGGRVETPKAKAQAKIDTTPIANAKTAQELDQVLGGLVAKAKTDAELKAYVEAGKKRESELKAPKSANTTRADAKEFDRLMLEYGIQERWVANPEAAYDQSADLGQQQGTASVKARIMRSKEIAKARRRAAYQIAGTSDIDPSKPEVRAQLLPKLREYVEGKYEAPARQAKAWEKATAEGKQAVNVDDLKVGDVLDVEGDKVKVAAIDPDTGDVTLQDGTRFGRQVMSSGQVIYVEDLDAKEAGTDFLADEPQPPATPKLRQGEQQGDLMANQTEDFKLAQDTTTDGDRITREREQKARDKAESEKGQADWVLEKLNKAIDATNHDPTKLQEGVTGAPVWLTKAALNGALRVIRAAYRGGKRLAQAIEEGIDYLKGQGIKGFDAGEARSWLENNVWENVEEGRLKVTRNRGPREAGESETATTKKEAYAKDQLARMGASLIHGNALPREFREARDWGLSMQRYFEENLRLMVEDTRRALRHEFKTPEDQAAAEERLRQYWIGEADVSTVGGPALQKAAASFRDAVDELTTVAVRNGLVPDEKKQNWLDNRGEWLRRTYLAFDPTADWNYDTLKRRMDKGDAEVTRIWNNVKGYLEAQNPQADEKAIEAAMRELIDRREAENALLGNSPPPGSGKRFSVDTGSLLRRKDLPLAIREWMGEIKDPFVRGLQSGKWMSQFITRNLVQRRWAKIGTKMGFLSEKAEGRNFVELFPNQNRLMQKLDEEGKPITTDEGDPVAEWRQSVDRRHEPLHGFYTSPEFKAALDEFNGTAGQMSSLMNTAQLLGKIYLGAVKATKWALVGMNPYSWSVNSLGGQIMRLAAGGINPIHYKQAFTAVLRGDNPVDVDATEQQLRDRATYLLATRAGMIGKGIMQGDIQGSSQHRSDPRAWATAKQAIIDIAKDWRATGAWTRLRRSLIDIAMKPGNFGVKFMDDVFRVSAFLDELQLAKEAFPDWKHEKQVEWAAERASNTYQNYDKLPDALRGFSQAGALNTFVSFKVEMFRNAFWILRYAYQGIDSNNPALRRDGYKKLVAFSAMATLPFIAAALSRLHFADDEDEDYADANKQVDALKRWVVPPWDSGEELVIMKRDGNKWSYVPMGYIVPTYEVTRPLATLVDAAKEENGEQALQRIMQGFASDYLGPGTVLQPAGEALFNKTLGGGTISEAEGLRGFKERASHALSTMRPKIGDPVFETYKATTGQLGNYGRTYSGSEVAWKLGGFRVRTVDVEKQLLYKMQDFSRRYSQAKSYSTKAERRNPSDTETVTDAKEYTAAKREAIREEYKAFYRDMTKTLGVKSGDWLKAQKDAGVPSELKAQAQ